MATNFVENTPVDEALYPSYDEASAAVNEQYAQGTASVAQFGDEIATNTASLQNQVLGDMAQLPGNITMPEAMGASAGYEDILELVSAELAIMQTSLDQSMQMSNNMMQNYIESMEAGLPMFEKYVDSRIDSLETRFSGGGGSGPDTDEDDPEDDIDEDAQVLADAAEALGMTVEEAFPHVGSPLQDFSWANPGILQDDNGYNIGGVLANMYGVHDAWQHSTFYNVNETTGATELKEGYKKFNESFNGFIGMGATSEVAKLLAMGELEQTYGSNFQQLESMGGVTTQELGQFADILIDATLVTNGETPDIGGRAGVVQSMFDMPSATDTEINPETGEPEETEEAKEEKIKEETETDIRKLEEEIPDFGTGISRTHKLGNVSDDVLMQGLEELLTSQARTNDPRGALTRKERRDINKVGDADSVEEAVDTLKNLNTGFARRDSGLVPEITGMADEGRTEAQQAAMALLASEGFSPNINTDTREIFPKYASGPDREGGRVQAMYEKALAKKKAQEEAYLRAMADQNVRAQAREQQIINSGPPPKFTYNPADYSNFAVF